MGHLSNWKGHLKTVNKEIYSAFFCLFLKENIVILRRFNFQVALPQNITWGKLIMAARLWNPVSCYQQGKGLIIASTKRKCFGDYDTVTLTLLYWKFAKFLLSFWKVKVSFPSKFASIFSAIKHDSSVYFFRSNIVYFSQKEPIKVQIFEPFRVLGSKIVKLWCQFWNDKSIPFPILQNFSLSWHITPL